ncbi:hypothetical protein AMTR_s00102p00109590 [Amborella trichopoda]|uniref:Uncharacterized protein n=1 Tax=Amborella trichopoda TaxID=13333 RepID=W1NZ23_AMBTC|nr:hypothetical protein AMTR_s00102p00109590 [Amborella trichopoda]
MVVKRQKVTLGSGSSSFTIGGHLFATIMMKDSRKELGVLDPMELNMRFNYAKLKIKKKNDLNGGIEVAQSAYDMGYDMEYSNVNVGPNCDEAKEILEHLKMNLEA